jgi:hypothetical protein
LSEFRADIHPALGRSSFIVTPNAVGEVLGFLKRQASGGARLLGNAKAFGQRATKSPGKKHG